MADDLSRAARADAPRTVGVVIVHGNGEAEPGWMNPCVLDRLKPYLTATVGPTALELDAGSTVHDVADRGAPHASTNGAAATFRVTERKGRLANGGDVTFVEMNWADLSRIGSAPIAQFFAALRLLYQAPNVLGRAFMHRTPYLFHKVLRRSILLAIDTVRWLIAGMNGTIIACALLVGIGNLIADPLSQTKLGPLLRLDNGRLSGATLAWYLIIMLAAGAFIAYRFARRSELESNGLADVAYSTAIFSGLGCILLFFLAVTGLNPLVRPTEYLALAMRSLIFPWIVWSVLILVASLLLSLLVLKRMVTKIPDDAPSLARLSGALGLAAQQGAFLKIALSFIGLAIVNFRYEVDCPRNSPIANLCAPFVHLWLPNDIIRLGGVFTINSLIVAVAIVVTGALLSTAFIMRRWLRLKSERVARWRPRVILNHLLVIVLIVMTLINTYVYYGGLLVEAFAEIISIAQQVGIPSPLNSRFDKLPMPVLLGWVDYHKISRNAPLHVTLIVALLTLAVLLVKGRVQSFFSGLVHFVGDVVDHHFRPIKKMLPLVTAVEKQLPKSITGPGFSVPRSQLAQYPRRERIMQRLDSVMGQLFAEHTFDRLVFVAHSQGTVIVHDYLRTIGSSGKLDGAGEIHVITLASPLTHLYQHYFEEYRQASLAPGWLPARLLSWSNLWRLDDPIADTIRLEGPPVIVDGVLGLGGHVDYWREQSVLLMIHRLLTLPLGVTDVMPDEIRLKPEATAAARVTAGARQVVRPA